MLKMKTRMVKPPTRLFRLFLVVICATFCSCSLFRVYAGKVTYADNQRQFMMTADSLTAESNQSLKIKSQNRFYYENSTR